MEFEPSGGFYYYKHYKQFKKLKDMNNYFFECVKHTGYWRKKAIESMPGVSVVVPVCGGYLGFVYYSDYELWKNQK